MAHGLAVRADRAHVGRSDAHPREQSRGSAGEGFRDLHVEFAEDVQRHFADSLAERDEARAQPRIPGKRLAGDQRAVIAFEAHERGVDAVGARAGDQAEVEPCVAQAFFFFAGFGVASA